MLERERHQDRSAPGPLLVRVLSYLATAVIWVVFGVFMLMWRNLQFRNRGLRDADNL